MGTKMKGILKGIRYISQIFEDDKEPEMQIGHPTDVKHVAHIGWDGPSIDSPSWMKDFNSPQGCQSGPLNKNGEAKENPEVSWVSEDSNPRSGQAQNPSAKGLRELPKSSRRQSLPDGTLASESITRDRSTKSRHSRRHHSAGSSTKDSSDNIEPTRQDSSVGSDSSSHNPPDTAKKSRRKKSKESVGGGSVRSSSRSKATNSVTYTSPFSDPGSEPASISICSSDLCQSPRLKSHVQEEENSGGS